MKSLLVQAIAVTSAATVAVTAVSAVSPADSPAVSPLTSVAAPPYEPPSLTVAARAPTAAFGAPAVPAPRGAARVTPAHRWSWPLTPLPEVARPFIRPASRYGAGHRGVDLVGRAGQRVLAVDDGVIGHVGVVAGRGTVTVVHASGLRSTYEPLTATVHQGQVVSRGSALGALAEDGSHCGAVACLHLGALRGDEYVDPLTLLGGTRVRLLPLR